MKKKFACLFGIVVSGIALASCSGEDSNLSTSKDFDLPLRDIWDSNAKLLTEEEKAQIYETYKSYTLDSNKVKDYMDNYSSIVVVGKRRFSTKEESLEYLSKFILDYKNNTYWYYEKEIKTVNEEKNISEIETKLVLKDNKYIAKTSLNLNNYRYWECKEDDFGNTEENTYKVNGKAEFYTTLSKSFTEGILLSKVTDLNQNFYYISEGNRFINYGSAYVYTLNNYTYCILNDNSNMHILITDNEYMYDYIKYENSNYNYDTKEYDKNTNEYFSECYLVKDNLLDDSLNLSDIKEYAYDFTEYYKQEMLPFLNTSTSSTAFISNGVVDSIPRDLYESNFTVE